MFYFIHKKKDFYNLYNNIVLLTRKKALYNEIGIDDNLTNKLYLVLLHLFFVLRILKKSNKNKKISQDIYDFFFIQIENDLRQIGYGDIAVNKKMKEILNLFSEILIFCDKWELNDNKKKFKYFNNLFKINNKTNFNVEKFIEYLDKYAVYLEDIPFNSLIKGVLNLKN